MIEKYARHIQNLYSEPGVADFAKTVYDGAMAVKNGTMSKQEFDDNVYMEIYETDHADLRMAKNAINHIKKRLCL